LADGLRMAGDGFTAGEEDAPASLHPRMESAMLSGLQAAQSSEAFPASFSSMG